VTWLYTLVQPRVKHAQTLTVKGMMKNWWNFNSEVTKLLTHDTEEAKHVLKFNKEK
jgi:hypothetical protein